MRATRECKDFYALSLAIGSNCPLNTDRTSSNKRASEPQFPWHTARANLFSGPIRNAKRENCTWMTYTMRQLPAVCRN